jgi:tripartite-type tricarboxylate transporter receptor subunit TctC
MLSKRFNWSAMIATIVLLAGGATAAAESYPDRPVKLIVPFAAGGPMDTMARFVGQKLQASLGQPVVVENRAGAGGALGSKAVVTADADGYTLLWGSSGTISILPELNKKLDYDPKAFTPVALVSLLPHVFVVPPAVPAKTVQEFVAYAKANPGKLNFGASLGTPPHLMGALFKHLTGLDILYIPYKGAAPSIADMMGGVTHMQFDALSADRRRQAAGAGSYQRAALAGAARRADDDRERLSDLPAECLVGRAGTGRNAGAYRRAAQRRHKRRAEDAGRAGEPGEAQRPDAAGLAAGLRRLHGRPGAQMGGAGAHIGREHRIVDDMAGARTVSRRAPSTYQPACKPGSVGRRLITSA